MQPPIQISGFGIACSPHEGMEDGDRLENRLSAAFRALPQGGSPVRMFHSIEEMAFLAAYEALSHAGITAPVGGDGIGVALGVDEGIDGIKARYYEGVLKDGPLGASPLAFPLTTPNTISSRISILLDLRGENVTVSGGSLSGAQAIGLAMHALREERCGAVLAGGATSVEQEFLDALRRVGRADGGEPRRGACLLLLKPQVSSHQADGTGELLGYAEGFGRDEIWDAVQACLEDAGLFPEQIGSVRVASGSNSRRLARMLRRVSARAPIVRSPASDLYSASFPLAVAEAAVDGSLGPVLVVGTDCLAGASAAIVRGNGQQ